MPMRATQPDSDSYSDSYSASVSDVDLKVTCPSRSPRSSTTPRSS